MAPFKGNSKPIDDVLTELDRHEWIMGHESEPARQKSGYRPTLGLIVLFNKTGCWNQNPKHPKLLPYSSHCSYVDVIHTTMEQGGASVNNNYPSFFPHGYHPGAACGAGQAEAFHGGFNRPYQGFGSGAYGRRGGVNWFQHRGRGYGCNPMAQRRGFESFHQP
jgi:hypothetical protein